MPPDHDSSGGEPTKHRMSNRATEATRRVGLREAPQNVSNGRAWETVRQRAERFSQQYYRGRDGHQEKMLRHVGRQESMVQNAQRRSYGHPQQSDSSDKCDW